MGGFGTTGRWTAPIMIMCAGATTAAEPAPTIGPSPAWVRDSAIPKINSAASEQPFQILLSSSQQRMWGDGSEIYGRTITMPQTTAGLQAVGNITIPWNSERSDLTIHHVSLRRGKEIIDLLKGQELTVLRRENNLENSTLDGVRTVVLQAPGLQVGDMVDVAITVRERPGTIRARPEAIIAVAETYPVGLIERRILIESGTNFDYKVDPSLSAMRKSKIGTQTELSLSRTNYVPVKLPDNLPLRYRAPLIQVSSYRSWPEVVAVMRPLFDSARAPAPNSAVLVEADLIAKTSPSPEARMLAALRLAQEKVRYVALSLGEGSHIPASADQTWTRKFGDCKGKVALLLAMLDRLQISAEPMLTNSQASELLTERLPTLAAFDHVVVRAQVAGHTYILDPTNYGQRTLDELKKAAFVSGLPLVANAALIAIPASPPSIPLTETNLEWDASKGFDQHVPYRATITYRGATASLFRAVQAAAPDRAALEDYLKQAMPAIENEHLKVVAIDAEGKHGEYSVRFAGKAPMSWDRDSAGRRFWFDHSVPSWKVDFQRKTGAWKEMPVTLSYPVWERSSETIVLPEKGAGFKLRGEPIDVRIAGTQITRTLALSTDRATVTSDFRRTTREISAEEARQAVAPLDRIEKDNASIVAPKNYVVSRAEVKALMSESASDYGAYLKRARLMMDQSNRAEALAALDNAIKLDPTRPEAPALQSVNHFVMRRFTEARAALAKAVANNADDEDTLRARSLLAWHDGDTELATRSIDKAIEINPHTSYYSIRSNFRAGLGRYDEALVDVRRAVEVAGGHPKHVAVARIEAASGKLTEALLTLDAAAKETRSDESDVGTLLVMKGDYLNRLGRQAEARASYKAALANVRRLLVEQIKLSSPAFDLEEPDFELELLTSTRNYEEAAALIKRIMAGKKYPSATHFAQRASIHLMSGNYQAAVDDARSALDLDPSDNSANLALAVGYVRLGRLADAVNQARLALKDNPGDALLHYTRAVARAGLNEQAGARDDFAAARRMRFDVALDPMFLGLRPQ